MRLLLVMMGLLLVAGCVHRPEPPIFVDWERVAPDRWESRPSCEVDDYHHSQVIYLEDGSAVTASLYCSCLDQTDINFSQTAAFWTTPVVVCCIE